MKQNYNEWREGDTVVCKVSTDSSFLRMGMLYALIDQNQHGNWQVRELESGKYSAHWYKAERFNMFEKKLVATSPTESSESLPKATKTVNGSNVRLVAITDDTTFPLVGVLKAKNGAWVNAQWTKKGYFLGTKGSEFDLVIEKPPVEPLVIEVAVGQRVRVFDDGSMLIDVNGYSVYMKTREVLEITEYVNKLK